MIYVKQEDDFRKWKHMQQQRAVLWLVIAKLYNNSFYICDLIVGNQILEKDV